ncbi:MAG: hypothetical protein EXR61_03735 [Chloroflexi bacterium]|nr:hypothetical protein [Chloroflexota bacterium]
MAAVAVGEASRDDVTVGLAAAEVAPGVAETLGSGAAGALAAAHADSSTAAIGATILTCGLHSLGIAKG